MALLSRQFGRLAASWIGWRARNVADPVERLRLLRRCAALRLSVPASRPAAPLRGRSLPLLTAALLVMLAPLGAFREPLSLPAFAGLSLPLPVPVPAAGQPPPDVWLVEEQPAFELYSNGLRIEREYEVSNEPRSYEIYARGREDLGPVGQRTAPAGIVFHSTESATAEFRQDQTPRLKLLGRNLLRFVREERAYHYVIDRFGRVWRIVRESDSANHAGHSIWADGRWTYFHLNSSFFGVSLEGRTADAGGAEPVTRAQVLALRLLTEMLRSRYSIPASNCVTHAQVSVNPSNRQAGYHYDWATGFPFASIGLPDNYQLPLPSLWLFGFTYDPSLVNLTGDSYWKGLVLGEDLLRQNATAHGMSVEQFRAHRAGVCRRILARLKERAQTARFSSGERSE